MNEINLYIDESGNLGTGGRFFLICALEVENSMRSAISKRARRVICRYKIKKGISKSTEIKGNHLKDADRCELIEQILFKGIKVHYIVLDLDHTTFLLEKPDDKNACYNYLIQLIIKDIIKKNQKIQKVNLCLDNRTVKIGNRLSLKPYLYNKFVLEQLEKNKKINRIEFNITYFASDSCYLIQWADIIANSIFKKYNIKDDKYYKLIKPFIIFESKFPSKDFGK